MQHRGTKAYIGLWDSKLVNWLEAKNLAARGALLLHLGLAAYTGGPWPSANGFRTSRIPSSVIF